MFLIQRIVWQSFVLIIYENKKSAPYIVKSAFFAVVPVEIPLLFLVDYLWSAIYIKSMVYDTSIGYSLVLYASATHVKSMVYDTDYEIGW